MTARSSTPPGSWSASPTSRRRSSPTRCRRSCSIPIWNVPNSIKTEEIRALPHRSKADGFGSAAAGTPRCSSVTIFASMLGGREIDPLEARLEPRRHPQPEHLSAAGTRQRARHVKFVFPNKHDVYMHDTTQKILFAQIGSRREPWLHAGAESATACPHSAASRIRAGRRRSVASAHQNG